VTENLGKQSPGTTSPSENRLKAFLDLFPGALRDGVVDAKQIGELLNLPVACPPDRKPSFGLNWAGRDLAVQAHHAISYASLAPDIENSHNWDSAENVFIEGDNLEVIKLLQNAYNDKVKLIYLDPPYNTGKDFVYSDDFSDARKHYLEVTGQVDSDGNKLVANPETSGRKHSNWLTMMYPRLQIARNMLTPDGSIFVSIDDSEVHNLRLLMDEVFGPENFVAELIWKSKSGGANDSKFFAVDHEYLICYSRDASKFKIGIDVMAEVTTSYSRSDENGQYGLERLDKQNLGYLASLDFPIIGPDGIEYVVEQKDPQNPNARWRWGQDSVRDRYSELVFENGKVYTKNYKKDGAIPRSLLVDERFGRTRTGSTEVAEMLGGPYFDNPKPTKLLSHLISVATNPGDLVMDLFAGSGSTGHAVANLNEAPGVRRKFVLVTINERTNPDKYAAKQGIEFVSEITRMRLKKIMEVSQSAKSQGLRCYQISPSSFELPLQQDEGQFELRATTLIGDFSPEAIVSEVFIKSGVRLDEPWIRKEFADVPAVESGGVLVLPSIKLTGDAIEQAVATKPKKIVFLEDAFSADGGDALRANAVFACKRENVVFVTF
jgi:adenine-specific DNA-methyltransferase